MSKKPIQLDLLDTLDAIEEMREAARAASRKASKLKWALAHPDYYRQYRQQNIEKLRVLNKAWADQNRERVRQTHQEWRNNNREHHRNRQRNYAKAHPEQVRESRRRDFKKNHGSHLAKLARRRAARIRATPKWVERSLVNEVYKKCAEITKSTGIIHEVDHIVPLKSKHVCGLHYPPNFRIITREENRIKKNFFDPLRWPQQGVPACLDP